MYGYVFCALCLYLSGVYGAARPNPAGVGAYAYQDSTGNRYGGTYNLKDGETFGSKNTFSNGNSEFFPEYFRNLQSLLHETFNDLNNQRLAFDAATKAFELTSNQAGFIPNFSRFAGEGAPFSGFGGFPGYGFENMPGFNGAFAGGIAAPGFSHQYAGINPENPNNPNVNVVNRFADSEDDGKPHFYSVSSSSYSTSSNVNGKESNQRGAHTVVNKDGKITEYKVGN